MRFTLTILILAIVFLCLLHADQKTKKQLEKQAGKPVLKKKSAIKRKNGRNGVTWRKQSAVVNSGTWRKQSAVVKSKERVIKGKGCDYVVISDLETKGSGCVNGSKFVLKTAAGARRQFAILNNKALLLYVNKGTKFTDCTSYIDVTANVTCKI
ncbi:uncharacterized protein LOC111711811 [Eurytemora carolleeae]|uniref:uncharacterized protein LOC111711811 n=1 Tax=Eurytemora carolleeae TaxID=1294199 RepID=UPI000C76A231|nr:uncharacterized protein LOC111711811 [Eurytemora carolleeae]|eukprot:XP_023342027.1 uncharacterized protein LOC111711811 [Eurytemora affinis]